MRLLLASMLVLSTLALACSSAAQRYRDASKACVDDHDTRAEIDACRADVRARFGVTPAPSATRDGGAP